MAVGVSALPFLCPVAGVRLGTARAGIRYPGREDLLVIEVARGAACAAVFTRNAFCAAPVLVAREHLAADAPRYLLVNSGNANAGMGVAGVIDARVTCKALAAIQHCRPSAVLPFSTGVIGERLPVEPIEAALGAACASLSEDGWSAAAAAIMTTDSIPKGVSRTIEVDGQSLTVTGIAKGAGMIRPDMATMLAFIATDAALEASLVRRCLKEALADSFHAITVDGDTSTNDACVLIATGQRGERTADAERPLYRAVARTVTEVAQALAQAIVRDGEGATRFLTIEVGTAVDEDEARRTAFTVAHSPLVKTACFAGDPNWGRILAAVGRAGIPDLDIERVDLFLEEVCVARGGARAAEYTEAGARKAMSGPEIWIRVELGRGSARTRVWTTDLSHGYVQINADYRT
jgi:glutamate N-acetyltransferase/amino-acid N-acetyltransferase